VESQAMSAERSVGSAGREVKGEEQSEPETEGQVSRRCMSGVAGPFLAGRETCRSVTILSL